MPGWNSLMRPSCPKASSLLHMHTRCVLAPGRREGNLQGAVRAGRPESWRFLSSTKTGRAPDAASLISAGIGLCFMTQLGRFSHMAKLPLEGYRVIQDTHFSLGGGASGWHRQGR